VRSGQSNQAIAISMQFVLRTLRLLLLGTVLSAALHAHAQPAASEVFQDWVLTCEAVGKPCYVSQSANLKETGQRVLRVAVGYLDAESKPLLHLSVPLGIYIPAGVALKIDEVAQLKAEVRTCTASGCEAILHLDNSLSESLEAAKTSQVAFLDALTRRQIVIVVSMAGFKEAYGALKQKTATR